MNKRKRCNYNKITPDRAGDMLVFDNPSHVKAQKSGTFERSLKDLCYTTRGLETRVMISKADYRKAQNQGKTHSQIVAMYAQDWKKTMQGGTPSWAGLSLNPSR